MLATDALTLETSIRPNRLPLRRRPMHSPMAGLNLIHAFNDGRLIAVVTLGTGGRVDEVVDVAAECFADALGTG